MMSENNDSNQTALIHQPKAELVEVQQAPPPATIEQTGMTLFPDKVEGLDDFENSYVRALILHHGNWRAALFAVKPVLQDLDVLTDQMLEQLMGNPKIIEAMSNYLKWMDQNHSFYLNTTLAAMHEIVIDPEQETGDKISAAKQLCGMLSGGKSKQTGPGTGGISDEGVNLMNNLLKHADKQLGRNKDVEKGWG